MREEKEGGRKKKRKKGRKEEMKRKYCGPCWMFLAWCRQILSLFFSSSMSSLWNELRILGHLCLLQLQLDWETQAITFSMLDWPSLPRIDSERNNKHRWLLSSMITSWLTKLSWFLYGNVPIGTFTWLSGMREKGEKGKCRKEMDFEIRGPTDY